MVTVSWDSVGVILVDFMSKGATINSDVYIITLKKLKARIQRVRPALEISKILLQHDNAGPHTSIKTREVISSFDWTKISHFSYSPDLAPSDFHLVGPLKESLSDEEVKIAKKIKWLKTQPVEFYNKGICALVKRWEKGSSESGRLHREVTMKCSCYILSCDARFVYLKLNVMKRNLVALLSMRRF